MPLPIIDGASILRLFEVPPFTVRRKAVGTYSSGMYVPSGTVTEIAFSGCSIQDPDGSEWEQLPEGARQTGAKKVYSPQRMQAADPVTGMEADEFDYKGVTYKVHKVGDWDENGGYYKSFALRVGH